MRFLAADPAAIEPREGFVYFIAEEPLADGVAKVGWAANPAARLRELQTGNPRRLVLIATTPGTYEDERWAHEQLQHHRGLGEWFDGLNLEQVHAFGLLEESSLGDLVEAALDPDDLIASVLVLEEAA